MSRASAAVWIVACAALLVLVPSVARAQERQEAPTPTGWRFTVAPYGALPFSIKGSATAGGTTVPIEIEPEDLFSRLDLAGALHFEAWKERWGLILDNVYVQLGRLSRANGSI